jgi:hypothetical protein
MAARTAPPPEDPPVKRLLFVLALSCGSTAAAQDPGDLLPYFPAEVNSMAVVNVAGILASPRAEKEGWSKLEHTEYLAGAVPVNPSIERILLAKEFVPSQPNKNWATSVTPLKKPLNLEKFAKAYNGVLTTAAETPVARIGENKYAVALKPDILGLMQSNNKSEVARWVRASQDATSSRQPGYINSAVRAHGKSHHIMLALSTADLVDAQNVGVAVATSKVLENNEAAAKEIQTFLANLRGIRAMIMVREVGLTVDLYLESARMAKADPAVLKAFVAEWLIHYGAYLEDFPAAGAAVAEGVARLSFKITDPELARVMVLFIPPLAHVSEENSLSVTPAGISPETTGKYYRTVNKVVDDLAKQAKEKVMTAQDYKKYALWYETAATKIETLSILGVDPAVANYGQGTAARLHTIADSLKGVPVAADALTAKSYSYRYTTVEMFFNGRNFYPVVNPFNTNSNYGEIQRKIDQTVANDEENRRKLLAQVERERSNMRQAMAEKYKTDIDTPPKK